MRNLCKMFEDHNYCYAFDDRVALEDGLDFCPDRNIRAESRVKVSPLTEQELADFFARGGFVKFERPDGGRRMKLDANRDEKEARRLRDDYDHIQNVCKIVESFDLEVWIDRHRAVVRDWLRLPRNAKRSLSHGARLKEQKAVCELPVRWNRGAQVGDRESHAPSLVRGLVPSVL
jgi:hypothetical protein